MVTKKKRLKRVYLIVLTQRVRGRSGVCSMKLNRNFLKPPEQE